MQDQPFDTLRALTVKGRQVGHFHSLPALEQAGLGTISRLPVSLRIMLESLLRHLDGERVQERHVRELAGWQPKAQRNDEKRSGFLLRRTRPCVSAVVKTARLRGAAAAGVLFSTSCEKKYNHLPGRLSRARRSAAMMTAEPC